MKEIFNLSSFIKFLQRNKGYTLIEVLGLSISMMFVVVIALYTTQELSTDSFQKNGDRIYIVGNEDSAETGAAIAYKIKERYPEVESVCPVVTTDGEEMKVTCDNKKMKTTVIFADSTFFSIFSFPLVNGDPNSVLSSIDYAVVSESFAKKMFGNESPIGKQLNLDGKLTVIINGIMKDINRSVIPETDIIVRWQNIKVFNSSLAPDQLSNAGSTFAFIMTKEGTDFKSRANEMRDWFKEFFWIYKRDISKEVRIESLSDLYFCGWGSYMLNSGDRPFVIVLLSTGILILIFAIINYINLTVAQAGFRAKEMATRRLLGSSRKELFLRLIVESTALTFISLLIGIFLVNLAAPYVNELLDTKLEIKSLFSPLWLISLITLTITVGVLAGLMPAIITSSSKPIDVVKGIFRTRTKMRFSKYFIIFQNVITITMIASSIVMISQIKHMIKAPVGYNSKGLLVMNSLDNEQLNSFINEVKSLPYVSKVGKTRGLPLFGSNNFTTTYQGKNIAFQEFQMTHECFELLGLTILKDNNLSTDGWYISEQAMREMNLTEDATSYTTDGDKPIAIAGIIKDFRCFGSITSELRPITLRFMEDDEQPWQLVIGVEGDKLIAKKAIGDIYERMTGLDFSAQYMEDALQNVFKSQIKMVKIVFIFSAIAIVISILGLLAMSTYFIQQRSMEVAVRKVFGSDNGQILKKLIYRFLSYVLIAFVIATPIVIYIMQKWLADYSYRIELSPLMIIAAGLFCLIISFITVFFQSYKASTSNPVTIFRHKE